MLVMMIVIHEYITHLWNNLYLAYWARAALGTIRYFFFDESEQALGLVEQLLTELKYV